MIVPNKNYLHASLLLKQLRDCGCTFVIISPGSRSTPLALAALEMDGWSCHVLPDERSAAFVALGLSKASQGPAILICTSGTAAANYFPAVIEAAQSCVPLIVLSADRPSAMRHSGAPQTIDQVHLFGAFPRFFADLPEPAADLESCRAVRSFALQAFASACGEPAGPVHINVPFDEPLTPLPLDEDACRKIRAELAADQLPAVRLAQSRVPSDQAVCRVAKTVGDSLCGLMVAGPDAARTPHEADAIYRLSRQLGWPVLADIASGLRFFAQPVFPHYDIFLRHQELNALAPDVILAFGAHPTSKVLNDYLDRHRAAHTIRIQPHTLGRDPAKRATELVECDTVSLCAELGARVSSSRDSLLFEPFRVASAKVAESLEPLAPEQCEALYVREAVRCLPDGAHLVLANSMAIRYADAFVGPLGSLYSVFVMRGANGIDGTVSHAAGIACAGQKATLLVTGDLAFLHDLGGLLAAARLAPHLTILLLNNNGGGIFHFLPVHEQLAPDRFEKLHGTPHHVNLAAAAELFGVDWRVIHRIQDLRESLLAPSARARVLEIRIPRPQNEQDHQRLVTRLTAEVDLA